MSRWLLFSMEMDHCLGPESLNPLFNRIVKSLRSCYNGLTIKGQTYRFAVSELRVTGNGMSTRLIFREIGECIHFAGDVMSLENQGLLAVCWT